MSLLRILFKLFLMLLVLNVSACGGGNASGPVNGAAPAATRLDTAIKLSWDKQQDKTYSVLVEEVPATSAGFTKTITDASSPVIINGVDNHKSYKVTIRDLTDSSSILDTTLPAMDTIVKFATKYGDIFLRLDYAHAPATVENFEANVRAGFYNNTLFHRAIKNFILQGGKLSASGSPKAYTGSPVINESGNGLANLRGTIAMVPDQATNESKTEFFLNISDNPSLDTKYPVFGKLLSGYKLIDALSNQYTNTVTPQYGPVPVVSRTQNIWFRGNLDNESTFAGPIPLDVCDSAGVRQHLYAIFTDLSGTLANDWAVKVFDDNVNTVGTGEVRFQNTFPLAGYNDVSVNYASANDAAASQLVLHMGDPSGINAAINASGVTSLTVRTSDGQCLWDGKERPANDVVIKSAEILVRDTSKNYSFATRRVEFQNFLSDEATATVITPVYDTTGERHVLKTVFSNNSAVLAGSWLVNVYDENGKQIGNTAEIRFDYTGSGMPLAGYNQFDIQYQSANDASTHPVTFYFGDPGTLTGVTVSTSAGSSSIGIKSVDGMSVAYSYKTFDGQAAGVPGQQPFIYVNPTSVNAYIYQQANGQYSSQTINVNVAYSAAMLSVQPADGSAFPGWLSYSSAGLTGAASPHLTFTVHPGQFDNSSGTTNLRLTTYRILSNSYSIDLPVNYHVINLPPLYTGNVSFTNKQSDLSPPATQTLSLDFGTLSNYSWRAYTANSNYIKQDWLKITPDQTNNQLDLSVVKVLKPGVYTEDLMLELSMDGNVVTTKPIPVTYTVVADRIEPHYVYPATAQPATAGQIFIRGTGFSQVPISDVTIGGVSATSFTVVNDTEIIADYAPISTIGEMPVNIASGTSSYALPQGLFVKNTTPLQVQTLTTLTPVERFVLDPVHDALLVKSEGLIGRYVENATGWVMTGQKAMPGTSLGMTPDSKYVLTAADKKLYVIDAVSLAVVNVYDLNIDMSIDAITNDGVAQIHSTPAQTDINGSAYWYVGLDLINDTLSKASQSMLGLKRMTRLKDKVLIVPSIYGTPTEFAGIYDSTDRSYHPSPDFSGIGATNRFAYSEDGSRIIAGGFSENVYDSNFKLLGSITSDSVINYNVMLSPDGTRAYRYSATDNNMYIYDLTAASPYPQIGSIPSNISVNTNNYKYSFDENYLVYAASPGIGFDLNTVNAP